MSAPLPPTAESRPAPAWRSAGAWITLVLVAALGLALDLWTKHAAFDRLAGYPVLVERERVLEISRIDPRGIQSLIPPHEPLVVAPKLLSFTLVLNPGAVFGIGAGQRGVFVLFTALALSGSAWAFVRMTSARDRVAHAGLGIFIAGAVGNLYDRLVYGCVRDFIHPLPGVVFPWGLDPLGARGQVWPYVSNVADLYLIIAIAMLGWYLWRKN